MAANTETYYPDDDGVIRVPGVGTYDTTGTPVKTIVVHDVTARENVGE